MEGKTDLKQAKLILGNNFIGPEEIRKLQPKMNVLDPLKIGPYPKILFSKELLEKNKKNYILILGIPFNGQSKPLTLNNMRDFFGFDPSISEPCFYNQDWYLKEDFADKKTLEYKWYLIRKRVIKKTRGKRPDEVEQMLENKENLPLAILTAYTFFAYYYLNGKMLWVNDFIWCCDQDHNRDIIYTGRYIDPTGVNKNGFNVHRHLAIRPVYGLAPEIV